MHAPSFMVALVALGAIQAQAQNATPQPGKAEPAEERYTTVEQPREDLNRVQKTEIYGSALPFLNSVSAKGATAAAPADATSLLNSASYIGINQPARTRVDGLALVGLRGRKDFGKVSGLWQIELSYDTSGDIQGLTGSRNSGVGLTGAWGTVLLGIWDTPYQWSSQKAAAIRGNSSFDYGNLIGTPGFNVPVSLTRSKRENTKADAGFNRRQGNIVQYWTPEYRGFSGRVAFSANEDRTVASGANVGVNPRIVSLAGSYESGGLMLRYAYETHKDYFGLSQLGTSTGAAPTASPGAIATNPTSNDVAHKIFAQYAFGNSRVAGILERLDYRTNDSTPGRVDRYQRDAMYVVGQTRFDRHTAWIGLGTANDGQCHRVGNAPCSTSGLSAKQATLGYVYSLDKNFDIYAAAFTVRNAKSATYGIFPTLGTTAPGARYNGVGLGLLAIF